MKILILLLLILCSGTDAKAGFIELGVSGNYRRSNVSEDAYDVTKSLTGSFSYYFAEKSAIELSYTEGSSERLIPNTPEGDIKTTLAYTLLGLDFVFSFGDKEAILAPYLKLGVAHIMEKKITIRFGTFEPVVTEEEPATVPSAGAGFKFALTKYLSLKAGIDAWTSRSMSEKPTRIDYAGRAGISWLF